MVSYKRTALLTVYSLEEQAKIRTILDQNDISYTISARYEQDCYGLFPVVDAQDLLTQSIQYVFYVSEKEIQHAISVLQKGGVRL